MIIIPIGIDCGICEVLNKYNFRNFALPFDWVVTYKGITEIIKNNFNNYIPEIDNNTEFIDGVPNIFNKYDVKFIHDKFQNKDQIDKYHRRIKRFNDILNNTDEEIIFLKKGHSHHHHEEYDFKDDITDVIELDNYLQENYKNLKYKIIVGLLCNKCYNSIELPENPRIIILKNLITDIRDNTLHNKIISGHYYEQLFRSQILLKYLK